LLLDSAMLPAAWKDAMEPEEIRRLDELADTHWWYRSRTALVEGLMRRKGIGLQGRRVLEVGCGCGGNISFLGGTDAVATDLSADCLRRAGRRGLNQLLRADAASLPFTDGAFDVVLALDVLEHIRDDAACVREVARVLKPAGVLLATVPALPALWSVHDEAFHHERRYSAGGLRHLLRENGFEPMELCYWSSPLLPFVFVLRKLRSAIGRQPPRSDFFLAELPGLSAICGALQSLERLSILKYHLRPPLGVSLIACSIRG